MIKEIVRNFREKKSKYADERERYRDHIRKERKRDR